MIKELDFLIKTKNDFLFLLLVGSSIKGFLGPNKLQAFRNYGSVTEPNII